MPNVAAREYSTISYDTRLVQLAYRLACYPYTNANQWRCIIKGAERGAGMEQRIELGQ